MSVMVVLPWNDNFTDDNVRLLIDSVTDVAADVPGTRPVYPLPIPLFRTPIRWSGATHG